MPSITFWTRLEPQTRSADVSASLAAAIHDPLWMLARQWQLGEFQGEDAGSPAWAELEFASADLGQIPLDPELQGQRFDPNTFLRLEWGQLAEDLLARAGLSGAIPEFRRAFPLAIDRKSEAGLNAEKPATDGYLLYREALASPSKIPAGVVIPPEAQAPCLATLRQFVAWLNEVTGGQPAQEHWDGRRLSYRASAGGYSYEWEPPAPPAWNTSSQRSLSGAPSSKQTIVPAPVRFPGMPNLRWWDFENGRIAFSRIEPDAADLGRIMLVDFCLVHGNDWFLIPLDQPLGSECRIVSLTARNVFGESIAVPPTTDGWRGIASVGGHQVLLPLASEVQVGEPLEEVLLVRDEDSNLVWAVEKPDLPVQAPETSNGSLTYTLQLELPPGYFPLVPSDGALLTLATAGLSKVPRTELVRTAAPISDEEIPKQGSRLVSRWARSRWIDGSTRIWFRYERSLGAAASFPGQLFDALR